jgi:hypothetical protein
VSRDLSQTGEGIMKRFAAFLLVLLTVASSASPQDPGGKKAPPDYYPLREGTKWHYRVEVGGKMVQVTNQIAKVETIDGQPLARLETVVGGQVTASEHLRTTAQGIFRHRYNGIDVTPPLCLLKYPVKDGESWASDVKIGGMQLKVRCRVGREEEVEVPAGKYKAVTSDVETEVGGVKITTKYWFASGVGVVKQTADLGGKAVSLQLEKFEPAGKRSRPR